MSRSAILAVWGLAAMAVGCAPAAPADPQTGEPVIDGTFTISLSGDPGTLDPYHTATFAPAFLLSFAYEGLVARDARGLPVPNLAESWDVTPASVSFKLRPAISCASGEPLTLRDVADNYLYALDPANNSPLLGPGGLPPGTRLRIDEAARTLTVEAPGPYSFLLDTAGTLPIICRRGLEDRSFLRRGTDGTGLFQLVEAVANSRYVLARRGGHHWAADGTRSGTPGVPRTVIVRIIPNQTTAANLLLAGELTAASISGPDRRRIEAAGFRAVRSRSPAVQMWFNQAPGRITADETVRRALAMGIDVPQLARIGSAGLGLSPVRLAGAEPMACPGNVVATAAMPFDMGAANALLDRAGWARGSDGIRMKGGRRLSLGLVWDQDLNDPTSSGYAAEYAVSQWRSLGAEVRSRSVSGAAVGEVLFGTGDYDISWIPIVVSTPSRFLLFVSGDPPPRGLNFPHADIPGVDRLVREANAMPGRSSCPRWDEIERLYLRHAAVLPVFDSDNAVLTRGATFAMNGLMLLPTSIRLVD